MRKAVLSDYSGSHSELVKHCGHSAEVFVAETGGEYKLLLCCKALQQAQKSDIV